MTSFEKSWWSTLEIWVLSISNELVIKSKVVGTLERFTPKLQLSDLATKYKPMAPIKLYWHQSKLKSSPNRFGWLVSLIIFGSYWKCLVLLLFSQNNSQSKRLKFYKNYQNVYSVSVYFCLNETIYNKGLA